MKWPKMLVAALGVCVLAGCAPSADPKGTSLPEDAPVVAFYGDSYTLGTGATDSSHRWSTRISEQRGWREVNPSMNALGFVAHREAFGVDLPAQIIEADPDIVFITMGLNDAYSYAEPGPDVRAAIDDDFDRLHSALPDARFIVVEPFWYTAVQPQSLDVVTEWVKAAADEIDADYIAGASSWIQGREGEMASDGQHPNDVGYDLMTEKMDAALRGLGL